MRKLLVSISISPILIWCVIELETLILRFISSVRYWFAVKVNFHQIHRVIWERWREWTRSCYRCYCYQFFVTFITKKAYYTSPDGIRITFHRCDLYDGLDSFVLSTFHRIKLKYVTTTKKLVCLLLLLLCGNIKSQPGPTNTSEFKTVISKKGIKFCHQNIRGLHGKTDEVQEILLSYNFDIFNLSVYLFSISEGTVSSDVIEKVVKVEV